MPVAVVWCVTQIRSFAALCRVDLPAFQPHLACGIFRPRLADRCVGPLYAFPARRIACRSPRFYASVLALALHALLAQHTVSVCAVCRVGLAQRAALDRRIGSLWIELRALHHFEVGFPCVRDGCVLRPQQAPASAPPGVPLEGRSAPSSRHGLSGYDGFITTGPTGNGFSFFRTVAVPYY